MKRRVFWLITLVVALSASVFAQVTTSRLDGSVKDQTGAVIPEATIVLTNMETNAAATTKTNELGVFVFAQVSAGRYSVSAEAPGFKKFVVENVKIDVSIPATVNFTLEVGEVTDVVEVTASEGQTVINTVNAELNTLVSRRQILDLPLNGRNPLELAGLQAGVTTNVDTRTAAVNGLRGTYNNLTQDGINIQDNFIRTDGFFGVTAPSVENVAEFSITTQNTGADAGIGVTQVKLITPSGSNEYHGSLFWFHRNTVLDANNFFNNALGLEREKLIRNQYGGRAGGPIFRDKLFFYSFYQGTRERSGASVLRFTLTEAARRGLYTYQANDGSTQTVDLFELAARRPDPTLGPLRADAAITELINLTPTPNDFTVGDRFNTAGFRFNSSVQADDDLVGFRIDYHPSLNHQVEAIFHYFDSRFPNDVFNDIGETFPGIPGGGQASTRKLGSYAWRWTPGPTLTNELRWGFQHAPVAFTNAQTFEQGYQLRFPEFNPDPAVPADTIVDNPIQNFLPQGRTAPVYELVDNVSWVKGNHALRFGGHLRWSNVDSFNNFGSIPEYQLGFGGVNGNPLTTGAFPGGIGSNDFNRASAILALLGGVVERATQTFNVRDRTSGFVPGLGEERRYRQRFLAFYGGDTWRLRQNLTLNLGLRWEWHSVPTEAGGLFLFPRDGFAGLRDPNAVLDFFGTGTGREIADNDLNNFAPSVSFAWDPFGTGKTSIRAGFGISYVVDNIFTAFANATGANDGLSQTVTRADLRGTVSSGGIQPIPEPEFMVPRTILDNLALNPFPALFTVDPKLRVPYVQQWTLSLERQLFADTAIEIRYVGNRGTKLVRAIDINQMDVVNNGFAADVLRAQQNMLHCRDSMGNGIPNPTSARLCDAGYQIQTLQIFPLLGFRGRTLLNNATVRTFITTGEAAQIVVLMFQGRDSVFDPASGAQIGPDFFFPNPNAFVTDFVGNNSFSTYHALQFEARRRLAQGFYFQFNYSFGKALTDFAGSQSNFSGRLDNNRPLLEKQRANFDVTHTANLNFVYELPFGPGARFLSGSRGVWGKLLEGWQMNGILQARSGPPISIISGRGTFNRTGFGRGDNNSANTTLTAEQLRQMSGLFFLSDGTPSIFDPRLIGPDGRANTQFFSNPNAGQVGTLGLTPIDGPGYVNVDFGLLKKTRFSTFLNESTEFEFRWEMFNAFNRTNFLTGLPNDSSGNKIAEDINSVEFGRISGAFAPRIMQVALKINF